MRDIRIFCQTPIVADAPFELPPSAAQHVVKVLRLREGQALTLFDGSGGEWAATITALRKDRVRVTARRHDPVERESPLAITLLQALARGEKMDWIVQKATELGVARLVPIATLRSVVQLDGERADKRLAHWRSVAIAACEQSGRNRLPEIATPVPLDAACAIAATRGIGMYRYALAPGDAPDFASALRALELQQGATPPRLTLLVGPEGGLTDEELARAADCGFSPVSLGPRVLRTETAGAAAIAVAQALLGDLRKISA